MERIDVPGLVGGEFLRMWPFWDHEGSNAVSYLRAQIRIFAEYGVRGGKGNACRASLAGGSGEVEAGVYRLAVFTTMLLRLSLITPSPTQRRRLTPLAFAAASFLPE